MTPAERRRKKDNVIKTMIMYGNRWPHYKWSRTYASIEIVVGRTYYIFTFYS